MSNVLQNHGMAVEELLKAHETIDRITAERDAARAALDDLFFRRPGSRMQARKIFASINAVASDERAE